MRTQLELWHVVKDNFNQHFKTGLCGVIDKIRVINILNIEEYDYLLKEIKEYGNTKDYFLGEPKDPKPRLEFIDKMIKKHSKKD